MNATLLFLFIYACILTFAYVIGGRTDNPFNPSAKVKRAKRELFESAASQLGMPLLKGTFLHPDIAIRGKIGGMGVSIIDLQMDKDPYRIEIEIRDSEKRFAQHLYLQSTDSIEYPSPDASAHAVHIGDPSFESKVMVRGTVALAVLDSFTRRTIERFVDSGSLTIEDGAMVWTSSERSRLSDYDVITATRDLCALVSSMILQPDELSARLARNALTDPVLGVRLANFEALLQMDRTKANVLEVAKSFLDSGIFRLQLRAAAFLRDQGAADLLLSLALDSANDLEIREEAFLEVTRDFPLVVSLPALDSVLSGSSPLRTVAIREIARLGVKEKLPSLLMRFPKAEGEELIALAEAIGTLADDSAEGMLLSRLQVQDPTAQVAIASALGEIASTSAVRHLLPLSKGHGVPANVKAAAQEAIERIQSRLHGAEAGQVSIASGAETAGGLSVPPDSGRLSEPTEES